MKVWHIGDEQKSSPSLETTGVYRRTLAWDISRCHGEGCSLRDTCLRFTELANMGPNTPQVGKMEEDPDLCERGISA